MRELALAKELAEVAGDILLKYYGKEFDVQHKGPRDLVTEVDLKVQERLCRQIRKEFPSDVIWAEEADLSEAEEAPRRWIIDPLDGTTNFRFGYPMFCVSIAFESANKLRCGVIFDPLRKEMFHAEYKKGAFLNRKRIRIRETKKLSDALLVTGFPYDLEDPSINNLPYFSHFVRRALAVRRDGSAALNMAYVACGRFSGLWEYGVQAWDIAAGVLLVREAGGKVIPLCTTLPTEYPAHLVAANAKLAKIIEQEIHLCSQEQKPFGIPDSFI